MDHRSAFELYFMLASPNINSGAMVSGVPTLVYAISIPFLANPKSPILIMSSFRKTFSNLKSRCKILFFLSSMNPFRIYFNIPTASVSHKNFLLHFSIYCNKSPWLQKSKTKKKLSSVYKNSYKCKILGWSMSRMIEISVSRSTLALWWRKFLFASFLIAYNLLVCMSTAL